jgi:2-alkyl-3-oxoalkanoate reductase
MPDRRLSGGGLAQIAFGAMRVFVAGASGVIGRPLLRQLVAAGHDVVGMTSGEAGTERISDAGAEAVVCDALDADAVRETVGSARPDVVVNELTKLPRDYDTRNMDERFYAPTNRIRTVGGGNLLAAAIAAGAQRFVTQSIAFLYAPEGDMVKDEEGRPSTDAPAPFGDGVRAMVSHERAVLDAEGIQGLVLRYGWFYGPGTYYAADGSIAQMVRKRRFPVLGGSDGLFSFIHIEDAAGATVAACERGESGIYNVVDDEPAPVREWLPVLANVLGAKPPRHFPRWLARVFAGEAAVMMGTEARGASNAKAKRELSWEPRYPSWRQGFVAAYASTTSADGRKSHPAAGATQSLT